MIFLHFSAFGHWPVVILIDIIIIILVHMYDIHITFVIYSVLYSYGVLEPVEELLRLEL